MQSNKLIGKAVIEKNTKEEDNLDNVENYHKPKLDNKGNMDRFLIMDFET